MIQRAADFLKAHLFAVTTILGGMLSAGGIALFLLSVPHAFGASDVVAMLVAGILGWFISTYSVYQVAWRVLNAVRTRRGRAIEVGSTVRILCGPHRDKIVQDYYLLASTSRWGGW